VEDRKLRVFLAHGHSDKDYVRDINALLKLDGFKSWLDEEKLLPGQDWELEIRKAVRESDAVVVFMSRQSIDQIGYLHKELSITLDVAKEQPEGSIFLIPIRLGEASVPERLQHLHWLAADPSADSVGLAYLALQEALLRKARQLEGDTKDEAEEARLEEVSGSSKSGYEDALRLLSSDTEIRYEAKGRYLVRGRNPNETKYFGIAEISGSSDALVLRANIGPHAFIYRGVFDGSVASFKGAHNVEYSIGAQGTFVGKWGKGGLEELIPASIRS